MALNGRSLYGVVVNMLDCDIIVSEFKLQSCYYKQRDMGEHEKKENQIQIRDGKKLYPHCTTS